MIFIAIIFIILFIAVITFIVLLHLKKISMGKCKCGGKYYFDFHENYIDKHVYKCDKCNKQVF